MKYGTASVQSLYMGQVTAGNGSNFIGTAQYVNAGYWQSEAQHQVFYQWMQGGNLIFWTSSGLTSYKLI